MTARKLIWQKGDRTLTFKELKELLKVTPAMDKVSSRNELLTTGTVFIERSIDDVTVTIFTNGFVLFRMDGKFTMFTLHICGAYIYGGSFTVHIPTSDFDNADWEVRSILAGEDCIHHSRINFDYDDKGVISYSAIAEDREELADDTYEGLKLLLCQERYE